MFILKRLFAFSAILQKFKALTRWPNSLLLDDQEGLSHLSVCISILEVVKQIILRKFFKYARY